MLHGRKMQIVYNTIDISEIPFKKYFDKNIPLTIIRNKEIQGKKAKCCFPFGRAVHSIETHNLLALSYYMRLQKEEEIYMKLIQSGKIPEIRCGCNQPDDEYMKIVYEDDGSNPTLICANCLKEWGKLPEEVLEVYDSQYPRHKIIVPDKNEEIWLVFDDKHIDWDKTNELVITRRQTND